MARLWMLSASWGSRKRAWATWMWCGVHGSVDVDLHQKIDADLRRIGHVETHTETHTDTQREGEVETKR